MHECVYAIKAYYIIRILYKLFAEILFHVFTHKTFSSLLQKAVIFSTFPGIFKMLQWDDILSAGMIHIYQN